ncbi:PI31 proteasome regulator N-terminal-domain-containing protein [Desarmillaria ectypa]|nr:PI31 proteasome regulator N-terminal-domain-containing protein [Desarmillaria ectypa]
MSKDILDPAALLSLLPTLLPPSAKVLASPQDGIAALLHAVLSALSFRLVGVDDSTTSFSDSNNVLPVEWNIQTPGNFTFRYKHDQSSLEFLVKVSKLGVRTVINAIALESDKAASLDIATNDFVSASFFPYDINASDGPPLVYGFISSNRVADFVSQLKLKIIQALVPGLRKEGYTEVTASEMASSAPNEALRAAQPPQIPRYNPDEEFPHRPPSSQLPPRNPLEIGRRDLDPFPVNPFNPPSLFPGGDDDGMFVGPNHPILGVGGRREWEQRGPWGGDGFLPPVGAPPGARFDPVGPGVVIPGRGRGLPGRGNIWGPDNDEFPPPGPHNDNMFS